MMLFICEDISHSFLFSPCLAWLLLLGRFSVLGCREAKDGWMDGWLTGLLQSMILLGWFGLFIATTGSKFHDPQSVKLSRGTARIGTEEGFSL